MKGYPKRINTKQDVSNLFGYLGTPEDTPAMRAMGKQFLQGLLTTQKRYVFDRELAEGEAADGSEPDYKVLENQGEAHDKRYQFILSDDPNGRIFQMGYAVDEVNNLIIKLES